MDIQHLIEEARQTMLTHGDVMPMLHLQLSESYLVFALDILSDRQSIPQQCGILARLTWEECQKYPGQTPIACAFYAEAWRTDKPENADARMYPSHSANRQEIISVQTWQVGRDPAFQSYRMPVVRDHTRRVIDVGPAQGPIDALSHQIEALVSGALDAQRPDEEVFGRMDRRITHIVGTLSEEKKQQLQAMLRGQGVPEHMLHT